MTAKTAGEESMPTHYRCAPGGSVFEDAPLFPFEVMSLKLKNALDISTKAVMAGRTSFE